jgi:mitochondrial protein MBA1
MTRIAKRADNERVTWTLDRYIRSPSTLLTGVHVISDRATIIPDLPKSGIRQVIVLITSIQTSETGKMRHKRGPQGNLTYVVDDSTLKRKQQTCSEYLVIQKQMWRGKEEPWRIWGHTQPTTLDDLDSPMFAMHNASLTMSERLEQMKSMIERR